MEGIGWEEGFENEALKDFWGPQAGMENGKFNDLWEFEEYGDVGGINGIKVLPFHMQEGMELM